MSLIIKELNKDLIRTANNNSMTGTRGDQSEYDYKRTAECITKYPISEEKKQQFLDKLYEMWSRKLSYEAQHVSVAVAGGSNYNAKKLDKGYKVLEISVEISNWISEIERQIEHSRAVMPKVAMLKRQIVWGVSGGYSVTSEWKKLAELSKDDFKSLYEHLDKKYHFKKNTVAYKLYQDLDNIVEKKKDVFFESADYTAYTEGDRAYIKFTLKCKRQLIVALKSRGWWWNARENVWSTYLDKLDKEWVSSIAERYAQYI